MKETGHVSPSPFHGSMHLAVTRGVTTDGNRNSAGQNPRDPAACSVLHLLGPAQLSLESTEIGLRVSPGKMSLHHFCFKANMS